MPQQSSYPSSFNRYLDDIGRYPLLTPGQELELGRQIQEGLALQQRGGPFKPNERRKIRAGTRAKDKLIKCNLRLVISIAKKYVIRVQSIGSNSMDIMDLISEGNIGLSTACDKYDHTRGYRFSTYAYWWIRQAVSRSIDQQARTMRIPVHKVDMLLKASITRRDFYAAHGREISRAELVRELKTTEQEYDLLLSRSRSVGSLNFRASDDTDRDELLDLLGKEDCNILNDETNPFEIKDEQLKAVMQSLPDKERYVLESYYEMNPDSEKKSLQQIGEEFGCSRERVRQVRMKAERRVRFKLGDRRKRARAEFRNDL